MKKPVSWLAWAGFFSVLLLVWSGMALWADNELILPAPWQVFQAMFLQLQQPGFWSAILLTLGRVVLSVLISLVCGGLLAVLSYLIPRAEFFITRLLLLLRSVPNIAFVILVLFWLDRELSVLLVLWLLLVPIVYSALYERLEEIGRRHRDLFILFPQPWPVRMKTVFLPELSGTWSAILTTASSLACKAGVMAEILCQVPGGIGRDMQVSRFAVDTSGVIAWTIWLLIFAFLLDRVWRTLPALIERIRP